MANFNGNFLANDQYGIGDTQNGATQDWWQLNAPQTGASPVTGPGGITLGPTIGSPVSIDGVTPTGAENGTWVGPNGQPIQAAATADPSSTDPFGGPIAPYGGTPPTFTPPELPDVLKNPWMMPTAADLQNTPGYQSRYMQGLDARQRSAAAHGTILNGGTQKALDRYGQDYASNEYGNLVNQSLQGRQQQAQDYLNLAYGPAWQQNEAATNQYGQLYNQYQQNIGNNRNAQNDYYNQQLELAKIGLGATTAGSPGTGGAQAG